MFKKIVGKEFYCRYCNSYDECRNKNHRNGIWFKVAIANTKKENPLIFIIGQGERENYFPFNIDVELNEKGHITCGGWYSLTDVIAETTDVPFNKLKKVKLTFSEQILLSKLLEENRVRILEELINHDIITTEDDWGLWNHLKPLMLIYISDKYVKLPLGARIKFKPKSWIAEFKYDNIRFNITKANFRNFKSDDYIEVSCGDWEKAKRRIYYKEIYGRQIVYYSLPSGLIGFEQYQELLHEPARIKRLSSISERYYLWFLFTYRLGDVIFIRKPYKQNEMNELVPATEDQFEKIKIIEGTMKTEDNFIIITGNNIVLQHPEHGMLELPQDEYIACQVPYLVRGHD